MGQQLVVLLTLKAGKNNVYSQHSFDPLQLHFGFKIDSRFFKLIKDIIHNVLHTFLRGTHVGQALLIDEKGGFHWRSHAPRRATQEATQLRNDEPNTWIPLCGCMCRFLRYCAAPLLNRLNLPAVPHCKFCALGAFKWHAHSDHSGPKCDWAAAEPEI